MYCYLIEDFPDDLVFCLYTGPHRCTVIYFSCDDTTFSCFLAFTQDHTDVMLFNRGFSRFSDDTPTFSCFLAFTQDHTDVMLFNRGFSRFSRLIEDFPVSVMIRLRFLVFLPLHRTTQM